MANAGIYEIRNILTGDYYIGQTANLARRWAEHRGRLSRGKSSLRHLQRAWTKYGPDAFSFRVLLVCEPFELTRHEQALVDRRHPQYNILRQCVKSALGVKRSQETCARISEAQKAAGHEISPEQRAKMVAGLRTPEARERNRLTRLGRKDSPETRAKKSVAARGVKHGPVSQETKTKLSAITRAQLARDSAFRARVSVGLRLGMRNSLESNARRAAAMRGKKRSPETIAKFVASMTGKKRSPEARARMREAARKYWADPEHRARQSEIVRASYERRRNVVED